MHSRRGTLFKTQDVCTELSICSFSISNYVTAKIHCESQQELEDEHDIHKPFQGDACECTYFNTAQKACKDVQRGRRLQYNSLPRRFHQAVEFVGNTLVNMPGTDGEALTLQAVSDQPPVLDAVSWNALVATYVDGGDIERAIACIHQMQCCGLSPNASTFTCVLKLCASIGAMDKGQLVHAQIHRTGLLEKGIAVGTVLVDMYARCGSLEKVREVFYKLPVQGIVSWNVLISGHMQHGLYKEALQCVDEMQNKGLNPNSITFAFILKSCGIIGAAIKGHEVHTHIVAQNLLGKSILVSNALVDMYAKCSLLESAQKVFQDLTNPDVIAWNTLITAFTQCDHFDEALRCFERMQCEGLSPSLVTFGCILKACGNLGALSKGQHVHAQSNQQVFLEKGKVLANTMLDMYLKCGSLTKAQVLFDKLPARDVVAWTLIVGGYAHAGHGEEANIYFERMQCESFCPNVFTFLEILRACGSTRTFKKLVRVHCQVFGEGLLEVDTTIPNALVDAYMKCGSVARAQEAFNKLSVWDSVSWNVLISGYAQLGHGEQALSSYKLMQDAGFWPDAFTYACICKACGSLCAAYEGQQIHAKIVREGILERDIVVANSLVDMFAKCGMLAEAQKVFNGLSIRNLVSWNSLIAGYTQHHLFDEALRCFEQMLSIGVSPDVFTFASIIGACGSLGASCKGREIHADIARDGPLETDMVVGSALIDMYTTLGMLAEAQEVFDELPVWDVTSLNTLLAGYSQSGENQLVVNSFAKLLVEGSNLDLVTFSVVLDACIQTGLLNEGQMYFETMSTTLCTILKAEHYTCLIDLFGRAGCLDKAVLILMEMPFYATFTVWLTLLGACQNCRHVVLGRWAFEHAAELGERDAAAHVLMSNLYVAVGMHEGITQG